MTEIQIINAMNQSVINKLTEFKNKELKKDELNKFMLINLSYILKKTKEIKTKTEKIKKEQDIEINKSLSKIKSYTEKFVFNQEELENKPIMKKMINQTLEVYIPLSEISYTTEINLYNEKSGKSKFNESILFKLREEKDSESDEKEIQFEEAPITFIKFTNDQEKIKYKDNYLNHVNDNFIDLINKYDEDIIPKKDDNDQYNTNLFYELINSFDEGDKEDLDNNCINLDFKEIKSTFYLDEIYNRKSYKRNSNENYITTSSLSGSTSFGSGSGSFSYNHPLFKEIFDSEFVNYISYDTFKKYLKLMSVDYLRYMLVIYSNTITKAKRWFYLEEKMFINCMKAFILKIGISSKKLYENITQSLFNGLNKEKENKENICSFENFLKSFSKILKFKEDNIVLKYKFILSLFRLGEEDINIKHVNIFLQLIKGEAVYDIELWDELNRSLVVKYDKIYPDDPGPNFRFDKMLICLESFFDKNMKH